MRDADSESDTQQPSVVESVLFRCLHVDVILLLLYTAVDKLVSGGLESNKKATDCETAVVVASGLTLVCIFVIEIFRHAFSGFVPGPFRWRVVRCFFIESILLSLHYRPISCLVDGEYLYIFGLLQGGWQGLLVLLVTAYYIKTTRLSQIRAVLCDDDIGDDADADAVPARTAQKSDVRTNTTHFDSQTRGPGARVPPTGSNRLEDSCSVCQNQLCTCSMPREQHTSISSLGKRHRSGGALAANHRTPQGDFWGTLHNPDAQREAWSRSSGKSGRLDGGGDRSREITPKDKHTGRSHGIRRQKIAPADALIQMDDMDV